METVLSRRFQFTPELWVQRVTGRITVLMDLECSVWPARISEQQCCTKVVIACREEFGLAGVHSPPLSVLKATVLDEIAPISRFSGSCRFVFARWASWWIFGKLRRTRPFVIHR